MGLRKRRKEKEKKNMLLWLTTNNIKVLVACQKLEWMDNKQWEWMSHISTCNYEFYHSLTLWLPWNKEKKRIRNQTERSALTKKWAAHWASMFQKLYLLFPIIHHVLSSLLPNTNHSTATLLLLFPTNHYM